VAKQLTVVVYRYLDYRAFLRDAYRDRKQHQRGFSYRWFSRRAGLSSPNFLKLVIAAFDLNVTETAFFCDLVAFNQARSPAEKNEYYERIRASRRHREVRALDHHEFDYFSRWYYPAVRELVACKGFRDDPAWIARRLVPPITPAQARHALELLTKLGLLRRDADGTLRQGEMLVSTGPEVRSLAVGNFHRQMMERAAASIELVAREERDISGLTVALSDEACHRFKQRIVELRAELLQLSAAETEATRVVQLNFQLFPLATTEEEP
jgi:uncharacterized protein (TIGR02147 family)